MTLSHRAILTAATLLGVMSTTALAQRGTPPPNEQIERATPTAVEAPTTTPTPTVAVEDARATPLPTWTPWPTAEPVGTPEPTATVEPTWTPEPEPTMPPELPRCEPGGPVPCGGKG